MNDSSTRRRRTQRLTLAAALVGAMTGAAVFHAFQRSPPVPVIETLQPAEAAETQIGEPRPDFNLPDLEGNLQNVSQWDGNLLVINFWATWCGPCRHEIPIFIDLQARYADRGLQIVGIAIDDPVSVAAYAGEVGMNYPRLHGQVEAMEVSERYGNGVGGLPFTVVVDRGGLIVARKTGPFEREEITELLLRHL